MNKSVGDAISDYHERALRHRQRFDVACKQHEKVNALREQIRQAGAQQLKEFMEGSGSSNGRMKKLEQQRETLIAKEISMTRYLCPQCGDTGKKEDGDYCNCLRRHIYTECYAAEDIEQLPMDWDHFDLEIFDDEVQLPNGYTQRKQMELFFKRAVEYMLEFPENRRRNLLMIGKAGLGKSYLMGCMAKDAFHQEVDVMLIRAHALFESFFQHRLGEAVNLSYLHQVDLLMIDDLGTEPMTQNVTREYFYDLLDRRIKQKKHTIVATNVSDLQRRYDDRIASRLESKDDSLTFVFEGQDVRLPY